MTFFIGRSMHLKIELSSFDNLVKKMLIKLSIAIAFTLFYIPSNAQQDPLYAQYINNPFLLNPAYAGFNNNLSASISYRKQWVGAEGAPTTINANGHISLLDNRMGAGLMFISDQIGNSTTTEIMASYSYRIKLDNTKTLSFGLQTGVANYKFDAEKVNPFDAGDPFFERTTSRVKPNFGAGLILSTDRYFIGLSVPRMLKTSLSEDGITAAVYVQHYYAMASYLIFISEHLRLKPSALLKLVDGAPASVDLNASLIIHENYQAGILSRNFNIYGLFFQGIFKDSFRLGYVFELPTGSSGMNSFSTHEIMIGFRMNTLKFHSNSSVLSF